MDSSPPLARIFLSCISANLGGLVVGLHLSVFSGILETKAFSDAMAPTEISHNIKSLITSALIVGTIFGALPAGPLCDKAGRRPALLLAAAIFALSTALMARATGVMLITFGRFLAGTAYAVANIVCPMYSAELSPPALRGLLVNVYQLSITIGILIAQLANWAFWTDTPWNSALFVALLPALAMVLAVYFWVPESPTWLFAQSKPMEAMEALHWLKQGVREENSTERLEEGGVPAKSSTQQKTGFWDLVRDPNGRKRLLIGMGLSAAQQFTGINAVIFFGPALVADVLRLEGSSAPFKAAAVVGTGNFLAGLLSMGIIERFGRRQLLLAAGWPMTASLVMLGLMRDGWLEKNGFLGIGALLSFICAFAITYGPLTFVVASEIFPVRYKGVAMSTCSMVMNVCALSIAAGFLPMLELLGGRVYYFYAGCMTLSSAFIYLFVPETRKLSLKDIDDLLSA